MTAQQKQTLWHWVQRLGLPTVMVVAVWLAYERSNAALQESHRDYLRETVQISKQQARTLEKISDVEARQTVVLEGVRQTQSQQCDMLREALGRTEGGGPESSRDERQESRAGPPGSLWPLALDPRLSTPTAFSPSALPLFRAESVISDGSPR